MTKKLVKISEILHLAADLHLAANLQDRLCDQEVYSCCAITEACLQTFGVDWSWSDYYIAQGLEELGLDTNSTDAFDNYGDTFEERQQARYGWLKLCALLAEEQEAAGYELWLD